MKKNSYFNILSHSAISLKLFYDDVIAHAQVNRFVYSDIIKWRHAYYFSFSDVIAHAQVNRKDLQRFLGLNDCEEMVYIRNVRKSRSQNAG